MVSYYIHEENRLLEVDDIRGPCWINLVSPTPTEVRHVCEALNISAELLTSALDPEERPRYETDDGALMLIIRIPIVNDDEDDEIPYLTRPLGILLASEAVITVCTKDTPILSDFVHERVKNFTLRSQIRFVLQIFYRVVIKYLQYLRDIEVQTSEIEKKVQRSFKNRELLRLLSYEKSLVYFSTSLKSNQIVMERLKKTSFFRVAISEERELLEDIIIDNTQAIEMAQIYTHILSGLMDTLASIISNNVSNVMRTLTKITIALMLPTLVSSFYGMNVSALPMADRSDVFSVLIGFSLILSLISLAILSYKRWF